MGWPSTGSSFMYCRWPFTMCSTSANTLISVSACLHQSVQFSWRLRYMAQCTWNLSNPVLYKTVMLNSPAPLLNFSSKLERGVLLAPPSTRPWHVCVWHFLLQLRMSEFPRPLVGRPFRRRPSPRIVLHRVILILREINSLSEFCHPLGEGRLAKLEERFKEHKKDARGFVQEHISHLIDLFPFVVYLLHSGCVQRFNAHL